MEYVKVQHGEVVERDDRMYVSSLDPKRLTTEQWLLLVRSRWGVENQNHHTLDTAFAEDDRPWIEADANGIAVLLLRRIVVAAFEEQLAGLRLREVAAATR